MSDPQLSFRIRNMCSVAAPFARAKGHYAKDGEFTAQAMAPAAVLGGPLLRATVAARPFSSLRSFTGVDPVTSDEFALLRRRFAPASLRSAA